MPGHKIWPLLLAFAPTIAVAAELPTYPYRDYCAVLGSESGGSFGERCLRQERFLVESAQKWLPSVPSDVFRTCDALARRGGGSYFILKSCTQSLTARRTPGPDEAPLRDPGPPAAP